MDLYAPPTRIEVRRDTSKGRGARGVYATATIEPGEIIERVPVILIPKAQVFGDSPQAKNAARISWYVFAWKVPTNREYVALALGYGSLYNHSFEPNARYECFAPDGIEFRCIRSIAAGDEILVNYNGEPEDKTPVDFPLT
jgi:uncharacterized protein